VEVEMLQRDVGFIGGGRATRIILGGLEKAAKIPLGVVVSDRDSNVLKKLKKRFPQITIAPGDNQSAALSQDIIFISVHPQALKDVAKEVSLNLNPDVTIISLMATVSIAKLKEEFGGIEKIIRMTPNAPSIVNAGFNPIAFSGGFTAGEKLEVIEMLSVLGKCPVVAEKKLESYAILTAMGPTYLWFQLYELERLGREFGLSAKEVEYAIPQMAIGAAKTMYESGLSAEEVMDLVPIRPLGDGEDEIKELFRTRLRALHERLRG